MGPLLWLLAACAGAAGLDAPPEPPPTAVPAISARSLDSSASAEPGAMEPMLPPPPRPAATPPAAALDMPAPVREAFLASRDLPLGPRVAAVTAPLLGKPYIADPLGEGVAPDADPLVRYDAFDCLTFVEEALALTLAPTLEDVAPTRLALRYGAADPSYTARHHFMELQWLPANVAAGRLRDITATLGPTTTLHKTVSADTWRNWASRGRFSHTDGQLPLGEMSLEVLTIDEALAALPNIPEGALLLTVRSDRAGVPLWISHVGITVPGDQPTVRHATRMSPASTRDHGLRWYLEHLRTYSNWPVAGVSIYLPVLPEVAQ